VSRNTTAWISVTAVVMALAMAGCASQRPAAGQRGTDLSVYMPLAVGNSWIYERDHLGATGEERVEIVREENGFFLDNRGNGFQVDAFGVRDAKRYLLRHPIEAGNQWTTVVSVSSMERYRILDVGSTCDAPAGAFRDCVRVEAQNRIDGERTLINEMTFAPGVGIVRLSLFLDEKGRRVPQGGLALKSFTVKPVPPPARR
jgi:hypothetical protein